MPENEWADFPQIKEMETLSTEFGPYYCGKNYFLGLVRGLGYLGSSFGAGVVMIISDNLSRKTSLLLCLSISLIGMVILVFSAKIEMAAAALFIYGLGTNPVLRLATVIFSEKVEKNLRTKFISSCLITYAVGVLVLGYIYNIFRNWNKTMIFFSICPQVVLILLVFFLMEDTPKFILKNNTAEEAAQKLNRIARINGKDREFTAG